MGVYHCPDCGEMVLACVDHPDYDRELTEEDYAFIEGRACWMHAHLARCLRSEIPADGLARVLHDVPGAAEASWCSTGHWEFLALVGVPKVGWLVQENEAVAEGRASWKWDNPGF